MEKKGEKVEGREGEPGRDWGGRDEMRALIALRGGENRKSPLAHCENMTGGRGRERSSNSSPTLIRQIRPALRFGYLAK